MSSFLGFFIHQLTISYADGVNLGDTPGFIYGLSYLVSAFIYCLTNPRLRRDKRSLIYSCLFGLFFLLFVIVTHKIPIYLFLPCVFIEFCSVCYMIHLGCDMNFRNIVFFGTRAYILGEFAASLEWQIFYYLIENCGIPLNPITQTVSILVTFFIIYSIAFLIETYINRDRIHLHVEREEMLAAFTIGVLIYAFSNLSYLDISTPFTTHSIFELFLIRTMVDAAGIFMLSMYYLMLKAAHARIEAMQMQTLLKMQYANYETSRESMDLVNRKYHDLKHQIALLRTETGEEKQQLLDQMVKEIQEYETVNRTGNEVLDAIISAKSRQCLKEGMKLTVVADGAALNFMNAMDISSMFGNILDNAIEAVRKVENTEKKRIHLTVSRKKGFLHITCENHFIGTLQIKNGLPMTSKRDNYYHGFGIKSIQKTAEKYNGSVTIRVEEDCFNLRVLIPLS